MTQASRLDRVNYWVEERIKDPVLSPIGYAFGWSVISLLPAVAIGGLLTFVLNLGGGSPAGNTDQLEALGLQGGELAWLVAFQFIVFAPVSETLVMALVFGFLCRWILHPLKVILINALFWAGLHSAVISIWGLVVFWPFLVFGLCYLTWRKQSLWKAIFVTSLTHALHNLLPTLAILSLI